MLRRSRCTRKPQKRWVPAPSGASGRRRSAGVSWFCVDERGGRLPLLVAFSRTRTRGDSRCPWPGLALKSARQTGDGLKSLRASKARRPHFFRYQMDETYVVLERKSADCPHGSLTYLARKEVPLHSENPETGGTCPSGASGRRRSARVSWFWKHSRGLSLPVAWPGLNQCKTDWRGLKSLRASIARGPQFFCYPMYKTYVVLERKSADCPHGGLPYLARKGVPLHSKNPETGGTCPSWASGRRRSTRVSWFCVERGRRLGPKRRWRSCWWGTRRGSKPCRTGRQILSSG